MDLSLGIEIYEDPGIYNRHSLVLDQHSLNSKKFYDSFCGEFDFNERYNTFTYAFEHYLFDPRVIEIIGMETAEKVKAYAIEQTSLRGLDIRGRQVKA